MGKTSAAVKNRWNAENYDRLSVMVPKGDKDKIKAKAESHGESINSYINRLIADDMSK